MSSNNNNNNKAIINNHYGKLQEVVLLLKIPVGTRKNFFEISRKFGYAPSKSFATPGLYTCSIKIMLQGIGVQLREWYFYNWRGEGGFLFSVAFPKRFPTVRL
jgi:hypothetical protein